VANDAQKQVYDNLLKRLIEKQYETVLPLLFAHLQPIKIEELTIEALLPPRRMDKVYLFTTLTRKYVLHLESEVSPKGRGRTNRRMLVYHALLYEKHNEQEEGIVVLSYMLYPFGGPEGQPEEWEHFEDQEQMHFRYHEIHLNLMDAHLFTDEQAVPLYGLLPAMAGTSEGLLKQAINDMIQYYESRNESDHLRDELLCFQTLLLRAKRLPPVELERVLKRVRMYDSLLEQDPWVQEKVAKGKAEGKIEGKAEGKIEGKAEGKIEATRNNIEFIVRARFPALVDLASERIKRIQDADELVQVFATVSTAPDENQARLYLLALGSNQ
jgi:predicted transposase YdaD